MQHSRRRGQAPGYEYQPHECVEDRRHEDIFGSSSNNSLIALQHVVIELHGCLMLTFARQPVPQVDDALMAETFCTCLAITQSYGVWMVEAIHKIPLTGYLLLFLLVGFHKHEAGWFDLIVIVAAATFVTAAMGYKQATVAMKLQGFAHIEVPATDGERRPDHFAAFRVDRSSHDTRGATSPTDQRVMPAEVGFTTTELMQTGGVLAVFGGNNLQLGRQAFERLRGKVAKSWG